MIEFAASFDTQLSPIAPFIFYFLLAASVFVQASLLIGVFLPGSALLFSAGLVASAREDVNIVILISMIFLAAFFGNQVGFVIGRKVGRPYFQRAKSPIMKRVLVRSENFYQKYGWWSVVIARFIPWVRTFVPPIAGTVKMNYYKFLSANILGAVLWGVGITVSGYYSGSIPWLKNFTYSIAALFIAASIISGVINYRRENRD